MVLLLDRQKTGWVEFPGGRLQPGETPEAAIHRKVKEELSGAVKITGKLGEAEGEEGGKPIKYEWYSATIPAGQRFKPKDPKQLMGFFFVPVSELSGRANASPAVRQLVREIAAGRIRPLSEAAAGRAVELGLPVPGKK